MSLVFALFVLFTGPALAADSSCATATPDISALATNKSSHLAEVVVTPRNMTRRTRDLSAWLKRLEGQYTYAGYVDLCGNGKPADQQPVTGKSDCVIVYHDFGEVPLRGLYCAIDVRWPQVRGEGGVQVMGGESTLSPAVVIYGVVPSLPGIQSMQIDNRGVATHARGLLTGDVLTSRVPCGASASCQQITRITARPDSEEVSMLIDVEVDGRRVLRHAFLLKRVSNIQIRPTIENLRSVGER